MSLVPMLFLAIKRGWGDKARVFHTWESTLRCAAYSSFPDGQSLSETRSPVPCILI